MHPKWQQQQGSALISALLILSVGVTLATFLYLEQRLLTRQTTLAVNADRMYAALQGVTEWGRESIKNNADIQKVKSLQKNIENMQISGMIYALNGRFNINCLQRSENISHFILLLENVLPKLNKAEAASLAFNIYAWFISNDVVDKIYLRREPAYRAAHKKMTDISELRLVAGVTEQIYSRLLPYLVALPTDIYSVNVNYASLPVLMSTNNFNQEQAKALLQCRARQGFFNSIEDLVRRCASEFELNTTALTTDNNFYWISAHAKLEDQQTTLTTLLSLTRTHEKIYIKTIWQEINGE